MAWNGDYHTNYNYEAPFYAALSTNHIAQMSWYDQAVLDWQSGAQTLASQNGFTGVLYPVGISPKGTSADMNLHNQKSDAVNLASDMVMHYEYTHDTAYAATVYPWLKQVGLFWQNYLTLDGNGVYNITNDAPHEDNAYPQTNSGMSLGLVHLLLQGLIDISTALGQDSATRVTWQNINTHLAALPTMTRNSQTILRETSVGVTTSSTTATTSTSSRSTRACRSAWTATRRCCRPPGTRSTSSPRPGTAATRRPRSIRRPRWSATTRARSSRTCTTRRPTRATTTWRSTTTAGGMRTSM